MDVDLLIRNARLVYAVTESDDSIAMAREDYREMADALEALRDDAARYRCLREKLVYQKSGPNYGWTLDELIPGDERDAAIDAAREKGK